MHIKFLSNVKNVLNKFQDINNILKFEFKDKLITLATMCPTQGLDER